MDLEVRTVSSDDGELWRSARLAALADAPHAFGSRFKVWVDADESRWRARLQIPGATDLLAIDLATNSPVGMVTGTPDPQDPDRAEIISMWVAPTARGKGIASMLITAVIRWAEQSGAGRLTLSVMPTNTAARRTYERNGFKASTIVGDMLTDGSHELIMTRDLGHHSRPNRDR